MRQALLEVPDGDYTERDQLRRRRHQHRAGHAQGRSSGSAAPRPRSTSPAPTRSPLGADHHRLGGGGPRRHRAEGRPRPAPPDERRGDAALPGAAAAGLDGAGAAADQPERPRGDGAKIAPADDRVRVAGGARAGRAPTTAAPPARSSSAVSTPARASKGQPFGSALVFGGAWGGTQESDGVCFCQSPLFNCRANIIEYSEKAMPVVIWEYARIDRLGGRRPLPRRVRRHLRLRGAVGHLLHADRRLLEVRRRGTRRRRRRRHSFGMLVRRTPPAASAPGTGSSRPSA